MGAYAFFSATTTDLMIANIKTQAEGYGWTIDFFGTYNSHNRLHLHNTDGAHFDIWWGSTSAVYIVGCTGYSSGSAPTAQPGVSGTCTITSTFSHLVVIGKHSIFIKMWGSGLVQVMQFGQMADKAGSWTGGCFISSTLSATALYSWALWVSSTNINSQILINGSWSALSSVAGGGVRGIDSGMVNLMPFSYSGGILPVPFMIVMMNPTTPGNLHPLGYAPDIRLFNGGTVYASLEEIAIDGDVWLAIKQMEGSGTNVGVPDMLIRLAA